MSQLFLAAKKTGVYSKLITKASFIVVGEQQAPPRGALSFSSLGCLSWLALSAEDACCRAWVGDVEQTLARVVPCAQCLAGVKIHPSVWLPNLRTPRTYKHFSRFNVFFYL